MFRYLVLITALLGSTLAWPAGAQNAQPTPPNPVLLSDDFADPARGSLPRQAPDPARTIVGYIEGEYQVHRIDPTFMGLNSVFLPGLYQNVAFAVDARLLGPTEGRAIVLLCRRQSAAMSNYRMELQTDRRIVRISRANAGQLTRLVERVSDAVLPGNAANRLELRCAGDSITALVNGTEVVSAQDAAYPSGGLSFGVTAPGATAEVRFDNLVVTELSAAPASGAPPVIAGPVDVAARMGPSVVQVNTPGGAGSGVQVAGGVLTNSHVARDADPIELVTSDGRRASAQLVKYDDALDLALLRTDLVLPPLELAPARALQQGAPLYVLGYPRSDVIGGQASLTQGIVSAVRATDAGRLEVQTDAAINPGNSGGPIANQEGRLVAIATYGVTQSQGLSFGVATESVEAFLAAPGAPPRTIASPAPGDAVLLRDDMEDADTGVLPTTRLPFANNMVGYVGGEYRVRTTVAGRQGVIVSVPGAYGDAALAVDARLLEPTTDRWIQLACRMQLGARAQGYAFGVFENAVVLDRVPSSGAPIATQTSALLPELAANRLELECAGTTITARINGEVVATLEDDTYASGNFFFAAWNQGQSGFVGAAFDNLLVGQR